MKAVTPMCTVIVRAAGIIVVRTVNMSMVGFLAADVTILISVMIVTRSKALMQYECAIAVIHTAVVNVEFQ